MAKTYTEVLKFNPLHDKLGRFAVSASPEGGGGAGSSPKKMTTGELHDAAVVANEVAAHAYLTGHPNAVKFSVEAQIKSGDAGGPRKDTFVAADVGKQGKNVMAADLHKAQAEYHRHRAANWRKQVQPTPAHHPTLRLDQPTQRLFLPREVFIEDAPDKTTNVSYVEREDHQHYLAAQFKGKSRQEVEAWIKSHPELRLADKGRIVQMYGLSDFPGSVDKTTPEQLMGSLTTRTFRVQSAKQRRLARMKQRRAQSSG